MKAKMREIDGVKWRVQLYRDPVEQRGTFTLELDGATNAQIARVTNAAVSTPGVTNGFRGSLVPKTWTADLVEEHFLRFEGTYFARPDKAREHRMWSIPFWMLDEAATETWLRANLGEP